jgi:Heparinase II/III-like protein.
MHPLLLNTNITYTVLMPTQLFGLIEHPVVGYWKQGETWGNTAGLTYMWHYVKYPTGILGPKGACLDAGQFPRADGTNTPPTVSEWPGAGSQNISDIDWSISPWNTSTGYIGMTFGSPGFITKSDVDDIIRNYSHIPNKYRTFYPPRSWRALDGIGVGPIGITGTEYITIDTAGGTQTYRTHWLKRKINFLSNELNTVYRYMGLSGFTCAHFDIDDEYFGMAGIGDMRGIGTIGLRPSVTNGGNSFINNVVYPANSQNSSNWYANFNGICAVPDSLILQGITSNRAFLLRRGFTTTNGNWRNVDGLTALGNCSAQGNIAAGGTPFASWFGPEYYSAWKDWVGYFITDLITDFKQINGICADNSLSADYDYYKTNAEIHNYSNPTPSGTSNSPTILTKSASDYVPFTSPTAFQDLGVFNYYSYNDHGNLGSFYNTYSSVAGDISSTAFYGPAEVDVYANGEYQIDRTLDQRGNSYGFAFGGNTFGKALVQVYEYYFGLYSKFRFSNPSLWNQNDARKWIPANYLGSTAPGQLVTCFTCAETLGNCGFFKFDPTGINGSSAANQNKVGFDRTPAYIGWHLNPVWGINVQTFNGGATLGPVNYIPIRGFDVLGGLSAGAESKRKLGGSTTWSTLTGALDPCGNPVPGNTLPPGTIYNNYWSHWYPMAYMSLLEQVRFGRHVARVNVADAVNQRNDPTNYPGISGSAWNKIQKPIQVWIASQKYFTNSTDISDNKPFSNYMYIPQGVTFNYTLTTSMATGITYIYGDVGPMYYENMRHQYLNKVGKFTYYNPPDHYTTTSISNTPPYVTQNGVFPKYYPQANTQTPQRVGGITSFGVCGAMMLSDVRKVNTIIGECHTVGNGTVKETLYLAPVNMDERSYLISGAQKINTNFLWRITFAHPATDPAPIIVRGMCSGITTAYNISGVTDYINNPNNKFGIWWNSGNLEIPIVENPPVSEAQRLNTLSLPENPKFMFNAETTAESRNIVPKNYVNPDLFCTLNSPYGYWNQAERWGSQNGLTYMWPNVEFIRGRNGPSQSDLNAGIFPPSAGVDQGWTGVGYNNFPDVDIDMSTFPWNSATGYIGLTFGATGFYSIAGLNRVIQDHSWIPNKYRVVMASRWWRAESNSPIMDTEAIVLTGDRRSSTAFKTPWLKRKMNFLRAELKAIYSHLSANGFTMAHFDLDDEIYGYLDYRGIGISGGIRIGDSNFYSKWLYPNNTPTGSKWYSTFYGASAAPDSFITRGITSMRANLLAKGFTSNPSNWRYVEGLTAIGGSIDNVPGNLAGDGSFEILGYEHQAAIKDWYAGHWTDMVDDFKLYNGIVADNSLSADYGYYKLNNAVINFTNPSYTNNFYVNNTKDHISDALTRTSTDYVPFVTNNITSASDKRMQDYYQYNDAFSLESCQNLYTEQVGDVGSIHAYGGIMADIDPNSNSPRIIDRNLDWRGNTYGLVINGITYGKNVGGWYWSWGAMGRKYGYSSPEASTTYAKKWVPANWVGISGPAQILQCYSCAEIMGSTGFFRYDPTGSNGSCAASITKVGFDRAPHYISWHLNPVWGINVNRLSSGYVAGPANYIPLYGPDTLNGLSFGGKTKYWTGANTTISVDKVDPCGNPFPGNTLPAGTIYNNYWTHWYPMGYMALMSDVKWGRQVAKSNVAKAIYERNDPNNHPKITGSNWYGIQKPINTWVAHQKWTSDASLDISDESNLFGSAYYIPEGLTFGYRTRVDAESTQLDGFTFMYGEAGPMYYENIRHQYLNKTGRYSYWNPSIYDMTASDGTPLSFMNESVCFGGRRYTQAQTSPTKIGGLTCMGICGAIKMALARKINTVIGECQTIGNGTVWETTYLAPMNMDERSYIISGAQKVDGNYVWRITFAHPATQSPIIVRGSVSGITTAYYVNGITNYIGTPNNKFGIWWNTDRYEIPVVENPPVSEAERLGVLNLPGASAFSYNPLTMTQAVEASNGIEVVTDIVNLSFNATERAATIPPMLANNIKYGELLYEQNVSASFGPNFTVNGASYQNLVRTSLNQFYGNTANKNYFGIDPYHLVLDYESDMTNYINGDVDPIAGLSCAKAIDLLNNLLAYTKAVSPNSIIYEYNCPSLPYYFAFTTGNACTWAGKSTAVTLVDYENEKTRLKTQHQNKISLFKANTDRVDIEAYPKYTDAFKYAKDTDAASSQLIYNNTLSASQVLLNNYPKSVPTQIFSSFTVSDGSEYILTGTASNSITGYTGLQNYQSLVSFNPHLGTYTLKPATDAGVKKMFIWFPLQYIINISKFAAGNCWGVLPGNFGVAGSYIYQARKVLNDLWCDTQTSIYTIPQTALSSYAFKYTLPLGNDEVWRGTTGVMPPNVDGRTADVQRLALQAGISKAVQIARLFKSYAGDTGPLTQDCALVISRGSTFIQGLTAYNGNLSYVPYDPSIFTTTGSTVTAQLASLANNYLPTLQTETGRYTRAYTNADVPLYNRYSSTITPNGSLSNCSNPMITQIVALTGSDTNIGNWIRTSGFNLAFGWKVGDARVADGRSISPGSTTYQATVLNNANTILSEISTHVPFERYGWTISDCDFNPNLLIYSGNEPVNDGKYLGSAWYNNGVISMMHALGTAGMTTGLETKLRGLLEGEIYGLVANWESKYAWYTKGQLTGLPTGSGQPNTNQWIEPAAALLNISLYLGDKKFLPSYNLGVALLAESFAYEGADGGFAEGFGYAQQTVGEMVNSVNYMVATGDTRLVDPVKFPFLQNYWQWAIDSQLPGNYIINCQDNRGGQQADYTIGYYWPSILASVLSYQGNTALANFKYLFPRSLPDLQGLQYTIAAQGITAALTIPNYKFYPDKQQVIWRTGRDKPSVIGNPYDAINSGTFGNTATPHYAIWAKGSSVKEGHKHTDQAHISVYQGYKVILMDCGVDYDTSNPLLINPMDTLMEATGHNMMQVDAVARSVVVAAPITVATLGATTGNITIDGTCAYTNINNCTRNIIWNSNGFNNPLTITISDNFNKTIGVTAGLEVYRFHTGNTNGISITGSGTGWTAAWDNVTMGITSNFSITIGQTGFNDFTQLVQSGTNIGNPRVHKMLNISTVGLIPAGNTFSLTTKLIVTP